MSKESELQEQLDAAYIATMETIEWPKFNNIPLFKCRSSAAGKIMTEPRGKSVREQMDDIQAEVAAKMQMQEDAKTKSGKMYENRAAKIEQLEARWHELDAIKDVPNLSSTCIAFLREWLNERESMYNRRVEISGKMLDKGNAVEDDAIVFLSGYIDEMGLVSKNLHHFSDEHLHGTPDIIGAEYVFDVKSSWNHNTFPLYETGLPESDYEWQVLCYMALTGKKKGLVTYALMSLPEAMIAKEARWKLPQDYTMEQYEEFASQYRYDDLPVHLRIKEFEVEYDQDKIDAIRQRVEDCRKYITNVLLPEVEKNRAKYQD